jgi:hypothetical protein
MICSAREYAVIVADLRLAASVAAVRTDWQHLKTSFRTTLTDPMLIAGVAIAAAAFGARSPVEGKPVECRCANGAPSLSRTVLLAIVGPLLKEAIVSGLANLGGHDAAKPATDASDARRQSANGAANP